MTEIQDSLKQATFDRASFIVGLSAALVAFYPLKDTVGSTGIILFTLSISLYNIALVFLGLLLLSAYLYGVNNIRYSFSRALKWQWTRWIESLASITYSIAFLLPILVLTLWLVSSLIMLIPTDPRLLFIVNSIITITGIIVLFYSGYFIFRKKKDSLIEEMQDLQEKLRLETDMAYKAGDLRVSVISLYQSLVSVIKSKLIQRIGITAQSLPDSRVITIALDIGLIKNDDLDAINDLKGVRDQMVHNINQIHFDKEFVMNIKKRIGEIIYRMIKMQTRNNEMRYHKD